MCSTARQNRARVGVCFRYRYLCLAHSNRAHRVAKRGCCLRRIVPWYRLFPAEADSNIIVVVTYLLGDYERRRVPWDHRVKSVNPITKRKLWSTLSSNAAIIRNSVGRATDRGVAISRPRCVATIPTSRDDGGNDSWKES